MNLNPQPSDKPRYALWPLARDIARQLNEPNRNVHEQIMRILQLCGEAFTQAVLDETLQIEAEGGMLTAAGDRRRTPGGVFFYLVLEHLPDGLRAKVRGLPQHRVPASERRHPLFDWGQRARLLKGMLEAHGEVDEVNVKIIGRPGKIHRYQNLVVLSMEDRPHPEATLPIGLPELPMEPVLYVVYIAAKQWDKVEKSLQNPEAQLIVSGFCVPDPETGGMAVFALEVARHKPRKKKPVPAETEAADAAQPSPAEAEKPTPVVAEKPEPGPAEVAKPRAKKTTPAEAKKRKASRPLPEVPPVELSAAEAAQKLTELRAAAASFQEKLDALEQLPENERYGADFTRKLLNNTLRQIEALEGQGE